MSRTTQRRVEQIAVSLTPQQAMLHWLETARQYPSMGEVVRHYQPLPESQWPLYRLHDQVEQAVERSLKGADRSRIAQALREARREVYFLFYLYTGLNTRFMQERRALWLWLALASSELKEVVCYDRHGQLAEWRNHLELLVAEVLMWEGAWSEIKRQYYEGQEVLMPEAVEQLTGLAEQVSRVVEMYNDWTEALHYDLQGRRKRKRPLPDPLPVLLDLDDVRARITASTVLQTAQIVDMAKAEACEAVGERSRALEYAGRHAFGGAVPSRPAS
jgi:hypothetical protein